MAFRPALGEEFRDFAKRWCGRNQRNFLNVSEGEFLEAYLKTAFLIIDFGGDANDIAIRRSCCVDRFDFDGDGKTDVSIFCLLNDNLVVSFINYGVQTPA